MPTIDELQQLQALPLAVKIRKTEQRIKEWVDRWGEDGVYVSFSGGKDSTVLLDIARKLYPNLKAMFVDVPTQYIELRDFVNTYENVDIVKPKISFIEVCEKYGFPLFSKEISSTINETKKYLKSVDKLNEAKTMLTDRQTDRQMIRYAYRMADMLGIDRRVNKENSLYKNLKMGNIPDITSRSRILMGCYPHKENGEETHEYSNLYDRSKYLFMLSAEFEVSDMCCKIMKKLPAHKYGRETGRKGITAQMADESKLRTSQWIKKGCNGFDLKNPISNPMSFWTEQDVLLYIKLNNLPICSVYGEVVKDYESMGQLEGQISIGELLGASELEIFELDKPILKTTGCSRTGCMLCGFGCHLEKSPNRFEQLKKTHPKMYALLDIVKNNGVTMREAIDWINEHGNMDIKY